MAHFSPVTSEKVFASKVVPILTFKPHFLQGPRCQTVHAVDGYSNDAGHDANYMEWPQSHC